MTAAGDLRHVPTRTISRKIIQYKLIGNMKIPTRQVDVVGTEYRVTRVVINSDISVNIGKQCEKLLPLYNECSGVPLN